MQRLHSNTRDMPELTESAGISPLPPADSKANILLVDDSAANLLVLGALLGGLDVNLVEARSGEEALQRIQSDEFAVVLLDVFMPEMDGFETAKRLRDDNRSRHIPIIFLTAADIDREQFESGYALGAVDFLIKPLLPVVLQAKVRGFVELFEEKRRTRREAELLRLLVEGASDYAIFRLDAEGYVSSWNVGAERIKQYHANEIIGQHFSRFYPQEAVDRGWPAHELKVARAEGRFEDEGWRVRKDGTQFWANVVITALRDESGYLRGFSKITRDMTERKKAEESARRLVAETTARGLAEENERRKDEFLATLAHELRNPLAAIRNSLQVLKMPRLDAPAAQQTREMMERQVHHLVRLVDDLLDVSRVMRGKIELRKELVELATVIARAVETAKPLIETQGHELSISVPAESLLVDADPVRLAQVIGNLLTNSARYSEPNGQIWLSARQEGEQAVLTVRDAGIGIAPDMLPHVFELFVQADHSTSKAHGGLGIGLTLVKNLVEMHGGNVEASSAGLGQGCEFVVRLPLQKQASPTIQEDIVPRPETTSAGHRLLVVDDNQDAALTLAMLLRLSGHEVQVAHRGARALEIAASFQPDLVFLDLGMPGMDGYQVARKMREIPGMEKAVLAALTGWGQKEDLRRTAEAGFDHHLVKPPEPELLEDLLGSLAKE
jgi:PAS domain S-box-containing protein